MHCYCTTIKVFTAYELLCRLNKNMVDGGSYITIGDLYKGNKMILPDRWKGKGLSVSYHMS